MTKLYKLTNQDWETRNRTKWGPGISHSTNGCGEMCGPGWLHAYTSPELALLLNPIHANIQNPVLWEAEGVIQKTDRGLKVGTTCLTTIQKLDLPVVGTECRVRFALLCAQEVYKEAKFSLWAQNWITGKDRSASEAAEAAQAARAAARAAEAAQAEQAAWAAARAARAARAAQAEQAEQAAEAAEAAEAAAQAARAAARAAAWAAASFDIDKLAFMAVHYND